MFAFRTTLRNAKSAAGQHEDRTAERARVLDLLVERGDDHRAWPRLVRRADRTDELHGFLLAAAHRYDGATGAEPDARRHARRDLRARARPERPGEPRHLRCGAGG